MSYDNGYHNTSTYEGGGGGGYNNGGGGGGGYRRPFHRINEDDVPESKHAVFIRGLPGDMTSEEIRDFFEDRIGPCSFDFVKATPDRSRLFVAVRFETREDAKLCMSRYGSDGEILGHRVDLQWFKDIRRYASYQAMQNGRGRGMGRGGFNNRGGYNRGGGPVRHYEGGKRRERESDKDRSSRSRSRSSSRSRSRSRSRSASRSSRSRSRSRSASRVSVSRERTPDEKRESSVDREKRDKRRAKKDKKHKKARRVSRSRSASGDRSEGELPSDEERDERRSRKEKRTKKRKHSKRSYSRSRSDSRSRSEDVSEEEERSTRKRSKKAAGKSFSPPRSDVSVERSPSPAADMIKPKTPPPQLKVNLPKPAPVVVTLEESPMPVRSSPVVETKHNPTAQIIHNTTFKVGLNSDDDMPKRVVRNAEVSVLPPPPAPPALAAQPTQPKPAARFVPIATPQTPVAAAPAPVAVAPTPVAPAAVASPLPAVLQRMSGSAAASGGVASRFPLSARVFADLKQFQDQVIAGVRPEKKEELGGLRLSALSTGGAGDNTLEKMMGRERMLETLSEVQMERFIAKKRQLEQQFKQDCETYAFVSKKLLSKDDSLASQLRMALIEVVEDMETQLMEKVDACLETISLC